MFVFAQEENIQLFTKIIKCIIYMYIKEIDLNYFKRFIKFGLRKYTV